MKIEYQIRLLYREQAPPPKIASYRLYAKDNIHDVMAEWFKAVDLSFENNDESLYWSNPREFEPHSHQNHCFLLFSVFCVCVCLSLSLSLSLFLRSEGREGEAVVVVFGRMGG